MREDEEAERVSKSSRKMIKKSFELSAWESQQRRLVKPFKESYGKMCLLLMTIVRPLAHTKTRLMETRRVKNEVNEISEHFACLSAAERHVKIFHFHLLSRGGLHCCRMTLGIVSRKRWDNGESIIKKWRLYVASSSSRSTNAKNFDRS